MKFTSTALLLMLALSGPAQAAESHPSDASIRELLKVMNVEKKNDEKVAIALNKIDQQFMTSITSAGADIRKMDILDDVRKKVGALLKQEMSWGKMEAEYVAAYKHTALTQQDVDAAIAFYKSDAGKHLTANLPAISGNLQMLIQMHLRQIMPKVEKIKEAGLAKLRGSDSGK